MWEYSKILLGDASKLFALKSLLTTSSNIFPLHLKQTFLLIIWIFTEGEGDGIKVFSTLCFLLCIIIMQILSNYYCWIKFREGKKKFLKRILLTQVFSFERFWSTSTLFLLCWAGSNWFMGRLTKATCTSHSIFKRFRVLRYMKLHNYWPLVWKGRTLSE